MLYTSIKDIYIKSLDREFRRIISCLYSYFLEFYYRSRNEKQFFPPFTANYYSGRKKTLLFSHYFHHLKFQQEKVFTIFPLFQMFAVLVGKQHSNIPTASIIYDSSRNILINHTYYLKLLYSQQVKIYLKASWGRTAPDSRQSAQSYNL